MKLGLVSLLLGLSLSAPAFALGELNCSSATGSLVRTEKEIWGANAVSWLHQGVEVPPNAVTLAKKKKTLMKHVTRDEAGRVVETRETFAVLATIAQDDMRFAEWLICEQWQNNAID